VVGTEEEIGAEEDAAIDELGAELASPLLGCTEMLAERAEEGATLNDAPDILAGEAESRPELAIPEMERPGIAAHAASRSC